MCAHLMCVRLSSARPWSGRVRRIIGRREPDRRVRSRRGFIHRARRIIARQAVAGRRVGVQVPGRSRRESIRRRSTVRRAAVIVLRVGAAAVRAPALARKGDVTQRRCAKQTARE